VNERDGMIPEWAPQGGVMVTWPHDQTDWRDDLARVDACFAAIAREIARRETLLAVCRDAAHVDHVRALVTAAGGDPARLVCAIAPSNDTWARDHGPIAVRRGGALRLLDFHFNGWGGKYPADLDERITRTLHAAGAFGGVQLESIDLVLEGGSLDVDGRGTLLTTASCLLTPTRNPRLDRAAVEATLRTHLGVKRVLWLEHGAIEGDDTDGHVDTLARFCNDRTIVYQGCDDPGDAHYPSLSAMAAELAELRDADGQPYRVVALPWPQPAHDPVTGRRLPATYANFLIVNGAVLVPAYDDPADEPARAVLAGCFPDREIVAIDCRALIRGFGSLHCVTMQLPAGAVAAPCGG
jgi:agmatine/peptidylarginine deiminase